MNENYCNLNNKIEHFDLKEIHLKNKDLSKNIPTTKSSHQASITQKPFVFYFFCIYYIYFNDVYFYDRLKLIRFFNHLSMF